jgi:hypothetical protein
MKKHTPGPWDFSTHLGMSECVIHGPKIMTHHAVVPFASSGNGSQQQAESNARLISAAPDLLAALQQCLVIVDAHRKTALGEGDIAAMNARAAIAKATGV